MYEIVISYRCPYYNYIMFGLISWHVFYVEIDIRSIHKGGYVSFYNSLKNKTKLQEVASILRKLEVVKRGRLQLIFINYVFRLKYTWNIF